MIKPENPLPPHVALAAIDAAKAKRILKGKEEAILERLEFLASDLFPDGAGFFETLFKAPRNDAAAGEIAPARTLGENFRLAAFADTESRRMDGIFYTPAPVIDRILDLVEPHLRKTGGSVCDPAMGCGFFHLRLVERLLAEKPRSAERIRKWAAACMFGVDVNPAAVFMTRVGLWLTLSDAKHEFIPNPENFRVGDSLLGKPFGSDKPNEGPGMDWPTAFPKIAAAGGFDCLVGNPPYEVLTNFSRYPERKTLADSIRRSGYYRESLEGQINLYRCFIERSLDLLKPGGALSFVVPFSLARDAAALPLRKRLLEKCAARKWLFFGERDRVFPGVTQSACIFLATKNGGRAEKLRVESEGSAGSISLATLEKFTGDALIIQHMDKAKEKLLTRIWDACPGRIADLADMRVGEADQTFFRDCMADAPTGTLLARGAHLSPFRLDLCEDNPKERYLRLDRFLEKKGPSADACRRRASVWRIAQLGIRNMHTSPRLVAALVPPGVYLGNSLNVYTPRDGMPLEYLAGILNSRLLDWLFRLSSANNNINLHEMRRLPFPAEPGDERMRDVVAAYRACAEAADTGADLAPHIEILNRAVEKCYGVEMGDGVSL